MIFTLTCWIVFGLQAQSKEEPFYAIEEFVTHISDSGKISRTVYFCISYCPSDMQQKLPSKVNKFRCKYFFLEDIGKVQRHTDQFFTIESPLCNGDTMDFLFTNVSIYRKNGEYQVEAECRGFSPIIPDVRIINYPAEKRTIQSRIIQVNKKGILRRSELF